jgi:putative effector of murein hydrolase LrgA (UPF0299 family)
LLFDYVAFTYYWDYGKKEAIDNVFSSSTKYFRIMLMIGWSVTLLVTRGWLGQSFNKILLGFLSIVIIASIRVDSLLNTALYSCIYYSLGYLFFYQASRMSLIPKKYIINFTIIGILILLTAIINDIINVRDVSNYGYFILSFLPMLFIYPKNTIKQYLIMACIVLGVVLSLKRGAIIACAFSGLLAIMYSKTSKQLAKSKSIFSFLIISLAFVVSVEIAGEGLIERFSDIQGEKAGSGRLLIWGMLLEKWNNSDLVTKLFGFGAEAAKNYLSIVYAQIYSHTDWLEILYNYGLIGLAVFIMLLYVFISKWIYLHKIKHYYTACIGISFVIFFLKAIYSGNMEHNIFIYQLIPVAVVLGVQSKEQIKEKKKTN